MHNPSGPILPTHPHGRVQPSCADKRRSCIGLRLLWLGLHGAEIDFQER